MYDYVLDCSGDSSDSSAMFDDAGHEDMKADFPTTEASTPTFATRIGLREVLHCRLGLILAWSLPGCDSPAAKDSHSQVEHLP